MSDWRNAIPAQWAKERMELIKELACTPGLTEDEREQSMVDLIRIQQRAGRPR